MKDVKCECGHVNPHGTILCESCGRMLAEDGEDNKLVDMRYEGTARRSQTYKKTIVDKIWNFFSSVKVGVWLIIITLLASSLGTIFPQQAYIPQTLPPEQYYREEYGKLGKLYYDLGFNQLYSSWWYIILVASLGISLVICSLDRVVPLYRALKTQRVDRHEDFLRRQRVYGVTQLEDHDVDIATIKKRLQDSKFKVREVDGKILAEKGRFSRWGPYINHIGLIIVLISGMMRLVPGMYYDKVLWVREGETEAIPGTKGEYYLENKKFTMEVYDKEKESEVFTTAIEKNGMVAKNFQTDAVLYKADGEPLPGEKPKLKQEKEQIIKVNEPLKFRTFALYQVTYKLDELNKMSFYLTEKSSGNKLGMVTLDLHNPEKTFDLGNGNKVEVVSYLPDWELNDEGEPITKTRIPNNPAFVFRMITPDKPDGEISFVAIKKTIEASENNTYKMAFAGIETKNVAGLTVRKDLTLPILGLGGFIFMIGVIQGAYWNHRRIWIQKKGNTIILAAHTNKNWHGLKREIKKTIEGLGLNEPEDQVEKKESAQ
ncbi:cytochrome c biogenesis protein ResB [Bacillus massiliigorillae]|uniref:cytochrome c biogenesis protein ResB n=1 Tax=Bacillus massiliigorillae TaxID=1243664 RepID=UPI0003A56C1C|nr:cytochrome c biogenesis protein ResB [Bacillus massiliigorillae]